MSIAVNTPDVNGTISYNADKTLVTFRGSLRYGAQGQVTFAAANPPDKHASFSGSGLPFYNAAQAFEHTPNVGHVSGDGAFTIEIKMPNSYYVSLGTILIPPTLYLTWKDSRTQQQHTRPIPVAQGIAYRKLTYPWQRTSAAFYSGNWELPVRTQEQILRDSAYKEHEEVTPGFWGLRPRA